MRRRSGCSISGNEGRMAQAWVNVKGGLRVFSVYFWHSEVLLGAVVKQAKTTRQKILRRAYGFEGSGCM